MKQSLLIVILCLSSTLAVDDQITAAENGRSCGPDDKGEILINNACFFYENKRLTNWTAAEKICQEQGGHLASLTSEEETKAFVQWAKKKLLFNDKAWIGLHSVGLDGSFEWVDGQLVEYTNWHEFKKVYNQKVCTYTEDSGSWEVTDCKENYGAICKIKEPVITSTTSEGPATNATETPFPGYCPPGWFSFGETSCYQVVNKNLTWQKANKFCNRIGQGLASIHSEEEQVFLTSLLGGQNISIWIGLIRAESSKLYNWSDSSEFEYTNWGPRQPSDQKLCVEMYVDPLHAGKWKDGNCSVRQPFLCHMERDGNITSTPTPSDKCIFDNVTFYEYRDSCYNVFYDNQTTWNSAESECQKFGGHLLSIMDVQEQSFVQLLREDNRDLWIGLSAEMKNLSSFFEWVDKWPVIISNWGINQPTLIDGQTRGCVVLTSDNKWAVGDCGASKGFFCKVTKQSPPDVVVPTGKCPHREDIEWQNIGTNYCYYINHDSFRSWGEAAEACAHLGDGVRLASFHSQNELDMLHKSIAMGEDLLWIGLARGHEGGFQWNDESSLNFIAWSSSQQSLKPGSACVNMNISNMSWNSDKCQQRLGFICMIDKEELTSTTESTTVTKFPPKCEAGWKYYNGYCYKTFMDYTKPSSWDEANGYCIKIGSQLASVHSDEENTFIRGMIKETLYYDDVLSEFPNKYFWLGMTRPAKSEAFFWSDNTTVDFTIMEHSNKTVSDRTCVSISRQSGMWYEGTCNRDNGLICKKLYGTPPPPTTIVPTIEVPGNCKDGWTRLGNKCLKVFDQTEYGVNWTTALKTCRQYYDDLLSIHSKHDEMVIISLLGLDNYTDGVWIGLRRNGGEDIFDWADLSDFDFSYWGAGEPSGGKENCIVLETSSVRAGKWRNTFCNESMGYICQDYPSDLITTVTPKYDNRTEEGFVTYGKADFKFEINATKATNWNEAEEECKKYGGHLASIKSPYEQAFIETQTDDVMGVDSLWIGLSDFTENGIFVWSDDWPIYFTNWASNEPKYPSHMTRCVYLDLKTEEWKSGDCLTPKGYICKVTDEKPPIVPPKNNMTCPENSQTTKWIDVGTDFCYYVSGGAEKEILSWDKAQEFCQTLDSNLISIHSDHEFDLLEPYLTSAERHIWTGLVRKYLGGFEWEDNSGVDFVHWHYFSPSNNTSHNCVEMSKNDLQWRDTSCSYRNGFICKVAKEPTTTPTTISSSPTGNITTSNVTTTEHTKTSESTMTTNSTATGETTATTGTNEPTPSTLTGGAIAGIVIGSIAAVAILATAAFFIVKRRRSQLNEPLISDRSAH